MALSRAEPRRFRDGSEREATPRPRIPSLETSKERSRTMLWTILIIVAIVAVGFFVFSRSRGRRSGV